ncbi:sulfotransferase domain-containing protein [Paraglaciecola marina]|uniref:sulfotransferase domain-containing protein n=1 Tax=Paraglaciecola marina TaxID=2500157 RepID=UPI00105E7E6F|nr:sulfotransferase domain-containing protein [Paraglaciecola marina]
MYPIIMVLSHRRSGTHLTIDSITNNFEIFNSAEKKEYFTLDHVFNKSKFKSDEDILNFLDILVTSPTVLKSHSINDITRYFNNCSSLVRNRVSEIFENSHKVYVYRDGRDVMVSLYHYQKSFNEKTREQTFSQFLRDPCGYDKHCHAGKIYSKPGFWGEHVNSWLSDENVEGVRYQDFIEDSESVLKRISSRTNFKLVDELVDLTMRKDGENLVRKNQRLINKRTSVSFRGGRVGDWSSTFSDEDVVYFQEELNLVSSSLNKILD